MRLTEANEIQYPLPKPLRRFWGLSVLLSLLCAGILESNYVFLHKRYPYDWPFIPFYHWKDFWCFRTRFTHFHHLDVFSTAPAFGARFMYPAPVGLLYEGFYLGGRYALTVFLIATGLPVLMSILYLGKAMVCRGVSVLTASLFLLSAVCLSYPLWFEYLLGNMEICVSLIVMAAVLAILKNRFMLAAVLIGFAISLKIFPFVYLGLLFSRRRYRECAVSLGVAVATNVVALWVMCPSLPIAYRGVREGLDAFRRYYMLTYIQVDTGFDHSLFGFLKQFGHRWLGWSLPPRLLAVYLALACVMGLALYFGWIRRLPLLNQITALTVASILLPPTSHDYTLLHLYVPWGALVLYELDLQRAGQRAGGMMGVFVCFAVLMSAESELIYRSGFSGQVKAIMLVVLLILAIRYPWQPNGEAETYA